MALTTNNAAKGGKKGRRTTSFCSILGIILIIGVLLVCMPAALPRIMGYEAYSIISGSMEPEIPVGSMVYAKAASPEEVSVGDVIVFYGGAGAAAVTTHRVAEKDETKRAFITKGDANAANDPLPVPYGQMIGKVETSVPVLGRLLPLVSGTSGKICLASILLAGVLLRVLGSRQKSKASM